jgi:hypothetical protein
LGKVPSDSAGLFTGIFIALLKGTGGHHMRANQAIAALAGTGLLVAGALLYSQPESVPPESGLGLDAHARAIAPKRAIREALTARPAEAQPASAVGRVPAAIAPQPAAATGQGYTRPFRSSVPILEKLRSSDSPAGSDGSVDRTEIVRARFKYPLIRIEERISPSGVLLGQREMVADHVLVQLQTGATRDDLEEVLSRQIGFTAYIRYAARTPGLYLVAFDGTDPGAMSRVIRSLQSETHVIAHSEPDLIVHAF